ncbi:hypothetical protein HBN50_05810 [Halobacteriovorax sp. GB3]|uniref:hypothetical protein n=1 Tax=Halobacteriovorax sp. GB3 TaxID=2719615 RepID=UPI00235FA4A8|nr:hypothetical protein [Halobacteriovorax sp. GB3]MDD0852601.1 hypothetical protein [Halobacteriovorax sp. GB3]
MKKIEKDQLDDGVVYTYFQYFKESDLPIYLRVALEDFEPDILGFLQEMKFDELKENEVEVVFKDINSRPNTRLLTISEASTQVAKQIEMAQDSDRYGHESIIPKNGYSVYRYKNVGMMVYSLASREWQLGAFPDFGSPHFEVASRSIINRYLAWSLSAVGILGFWASPVEDGLVVLRQGEAKGEAVFVDLRNRFMYSLDGKRKMKRRFKFLKLDRNLKNRNLPMQTEELASFLSVHCAYFDYKGLSTAVRQMISAVAKESVGLIYPAESFVPRKEASN